MADLTYLELIDRVQRRLVRTDLEAEAREHILERIEHYGKEFFYSSEISDDSITTVAGTRYYDLPVRWADVREVSVLNGVWIPMEKVSILVMEEEDVLVDALQSLPSHWCIHGGRLRIWPCGPNYKLDLLMNTSPAPPALDSDVTFWSTDAQSLIISAAAEKICSLVLNNPIREEKFKDERVSEERSLGSKSIRAMGGVKFRGHL